MKEASLNHVGMVCRKGTQGDALKQGAELACCSTYPSHHTGTSGTLAGNIHMPLEYRLQRQSFQSNLRSKITSKIADLLTYPFSISDFQIRRTSVGLLCPWNGCYAETFPVKD